MIRRYFDKTNKFFEFFNTKTGFYLRSGVLAKDENGKMVDTNVDPFMRDYPQLLDVGVMGTCIHGRSGLCQKAGIECYQNGLNVHKPNMTLANWKRIIDECKDKVFQIALGGRGDPNKHEDFEELLRYSAENHVVPNYTTSGLALTDSEIAATKKYCGACAVSHYIKKRYIKKGKLFLRKKK